MSGDVQIDVLCAPKVKSDFLPVPTLLEVDTHLGYLVFAIVCNNKPGPAQVGAISKAQK